MASLNKVMLIGNAGKDAELKYMATGTPQATFSLAVNHRKKVDVEWMDETVWANVVMWGDQAEKVSQYITKGKQLYVEGRMHTRNWEDDHGVRHWRTEVIADTVQLLGQREPQGKDRTTNRDVDIDDLPFE